jgi:hypothetical protein
VLISNAIVSICAPALLTTGVHVDAMQSLQIWVNPLGILKILNTNMLISLVKMWTPCRIPVLPLLNCRGWKLLILNKWMYIQDVFTMLWSA